MFGSYNKFKHRVHITATVISSLDFVTSIIASVLVFSILGAQSEETGIPVRELVAGGQGLAFISYPDALSQLPVPQLFTIMFFFMLFLLGIDSEFALLETVLTCVYDSVSSMFNFREIFNSIMEAGDVKVCRLQQDKGALGPLNKEQNGGKKFQNGAFLGYGNS